MPEDSKVSKAQQKAVNKYVKNNYDRINVTFPKGQKEKLKEHAKKQNESVNSFIIRSVSETMARDNAKSPLPSTPNELEQKPNTPAANEPELIEAADNKKDIPKLDTLTETNKPPKKRYKLFTEAEAKLIDLSELLTNVRYQIDTAETFGMEVLRTLMERARQQEQENSASD